MVLPYMTPAERTNAILNHIRINEIQECIMHQMNIIRAMQRDNLKQATANMSGHTVFSSSTGYKDHPLKTQYVIRDFRLDANKYHPMNALIGCLELKNLSQIRCSVQNHTLYGHRVCCFAACDDINDVVNMWAVLNYTTIILAVHSSDATAREQLSNFAIDPFGVTEQVKKMELKLSPISECAAKLLIIYFKGTTSHFIGSFMSEAIVFNRMLLEMYGSIATEFVPKIVLKNCEWIVSSAHIVYTVGPGFINFGDKPIIATATGLLSPGITDETDAMVDTAANQALQGDYLEQFVGKLLLVNDTTSRYNEGLLVTSSENWDANTSTFHFDSTKFGCFYTALLRQRLVVTDNAVINGEYCTVPTIKSKLVIKGRRTFEIQRTIETSVEVSVASIIPEYFATVAVTKKHAIGTIPIAMATPTGSYPVVSGQAIIEACSIETQDLQYQIGDKDYYSPEKGFIRDSLSKTDKDKKNLEIEPTDMYKFIVVGTIEDITQQVQQL
jgi:hypothetical protein